ncbi:MAG: phage head-tail connector protein [Alphaproteobacteria bacterium]|nr:MAG: phage head-tail connector protein [Alphaproteobacteria bacterium]
MALVLITPPALEPLTVAQARAHLRVDTTDDDVVIEELIRAARQRAEDCTGRALGQQTWELLLADFPTRGSPIDLPKPPNPSITSLTYIDPSGVSTVMPSTDYEIVPGSVLSRLTPVYGKTWPDTLRREACVKIRYQTGYIQVPAPILSWMKLLVGTLYDHRETVLRGETATASFLPSGVSDSLIDPYIVPSLA